MQVKAIIDAVKDLKGLTNYGIAKALRDRGIDITSQGIDGYAKGTGRVRLDVLCGLNELIGKGWNYTGKLIEGEMRK